MAAAAVEWAESYQDQGGAYRALIRWLPIAVVVICGVGAILLAVGGDALAAILNALIVLINLLFLMLNPTTRPQNIASCLEASREVVASR